MSPSVLRTCVRARITWEIVVNETRDIASLVIFMAFLLSSLCAVNGNSIRFIIGLGLYIYIYFILINLDRG